MIADTTRLFVQTSVQSAVLKISGMEIDKMEDLSKILKIEVETTKEELIDQIEILISQLEKSKKKLVEKLTINSLGIVQGTGSRVDLLCNKYMTLKRQFELYCSQMEKTWTDLTE